MRESFVLRVRGRYGKPLVVDTADVDMWHELPRLFDTVSRGEGRTGL